MELARLRAEHKDNEALLRKARKRAEQVRSGGRRVLLRAEEDRKVVEILPRGTLCYNGSYQNFELGRVLYTTGSRAWDGGFDRKKGGAEGEAGGDKESKPINERYLYDTSSYRWREEPVSIDVMLMMSRGGGGAEAQARSRLRLRVQ